MFQLTMKCSDEVASAKGKLESIQEDAVRAKSDEVEHLVHQYHFTVSEIQPHLDIQRDQRQISI